MAPLGARAPILAAALAVVVLAPCLTFAQPKLEGGGVKMQLMPDLEITAMGYSAGKLTFTIRNKGVGNAAVSKLKMSCQLDPNSPASCAVSFKPTENAGPVYVCPGFVSLNPQVLDLRALKSGEVYIHNKGAGFKPGCRYKVTVLADSSFQVAESNEGNNQQSYIAVVP